MVPRIENTILKVTTILTGWAKIALKIDWSLQKVVQKIITWTTLPITPQIVKVTRWQIIWILKVAFFQKVWFFIKSPNLSKKNQKTILNLKFKIPAHNIIPLWAGILNFKFRIVFRNFFLGDLDIWKTNCTFWKKATFKSSYWPANRDLPCF